MKATLRGVSGPASGIQVPLEEKTGVTVGRNPSCTVALPGDSYLSGTHFEVILSNERVLVRDPSSTNGTFVNGQRIREHVVQAGESILAGGSTFQVELSGADMPSVVDVLSSRAEPLFAVLDAARDPSIYPLLLTSGAQYMCLYTGKSASTLEAVAPYLVQLPQRCELLRKIVDEGWGKSWGIFLTSGQAPETIWHELRRSLMVRLETTQKLVYFRFYDPRVLRTFLPIADAQQRREFGGTMSSFLMEDEDESTVLCLYASRSELAVEKLAVCR